MPFGSRPRLLIACLLIAVVAGCSTRPFVVSGPKKFASKLESEQAAAVLAGHQAPWLLSLCYSGSFNTPEEVREEARYQCPGGAVTYLDSDLFWTPCGLLQPVRASFLCTPAPIEE